LITKPIKSDNQLTNLIDYIYLLRICKFSKKGLIKLFQNPSINIANFKDLNKDNLKLFLSNKKQNNIDLYSKFEKLFNFNFSDEKYTNIRKMVYYCRDHDISIITANTKNIPPIFKRVATIYRDLIFIKGHILEKDLFSYSICGSRNPTKNAIEKTRKIAQFFAEKGLTLINGFAKGIDIEAFKGANSKNGRYIGVLASGIENIYHPGNKKFVPYVIKNGALISQRLIFDSVNKTALQMRNRFSAQLTLGTIFIEGNYKSGTKWQYKFARELNKPIFYLEPKDWNHENTHVLNIIRENSGIKIKNDLSNLDEIYNLFLRKYKEINNL